MSRQTITPQLMLPEQIREVIEKYGTGSYYVVLANGDNHYIDEEVYTLRTPIGPMDIRGDDRSNKDIRFSLMHHITEAINKVAPAIGFSGGFSSISDIISLESAGRSAHRWNQPNTGPHHLVEVSITNCQKGSRSKYWGPRVETNCTFERSLAKRGPWKIQTGPRSRAKDANGMEAPLDHVAITAFVALASVFGISAEEVQRIRGT